jgi:hypothetical protein
MKMTILPEILIPQLYILNKINICVAYLKLCIHTYLSFKYVGLCTCKFYVQLGARNFAHQFLYHLKKLSSLSFIVIITNHDICDHD